MVTIGKAAAFIFKPLGFGSWQAVTALLSGFVAKEAVVTSIASLGGVSALFGGATAGLDAFCFMIFTLLYEPCIATVAALFKETGIKLNGDIFFVGTVREEGMGGFGGKPMQKRVLGNLVLVGDFETDILEYPPLAPRVTEAAALLADAMLEFILTGVE